MPPYSFFNLLDKGSLIFGKLNKLYGYFFKEQL